MDNDLRFEGVSTHALRVTGSSLPDATAQQLLLSQRMSAVLAQGPPTLQPHGKPVPYKNATECLQTVLHLREQGRSHTAARAIMDCRDMFRQLGSADAAGAALSEVEEALQVFTTHHVGALSLLSDVAVQSCHGAAQRWLARRVLLNWELSPQLITIALDSLYHLVVCPVVEPELVDALVTLALHRDQLPAALQDNDLHSTAVLMLGAACHVARAEPHGQAVLARLENELGSFDRARFRREAMESNRSAEGPASSPFGHGTREDHHAYLLHALGNAGSESSIPHVSSYLNGEAVPLRLRAAGECLGAVSEGGGKEEMSPRD